MAKHPIKQAFYQFYMMKMPVINFIVEQIQCMVKLNSTIEFIV